MKVTVKLFAYFRDNRFIKEEWQLAQGTKVADVVNKLEIDPEEIGVLMINSRHTSLDTELQEDNILAIFPVVGGG